MYSQYILPRICVLSRGAASLQSVARDQPLYNRLWVSNISLTSTYIVQCIYMYVLLGLPDVISGGRHLYLEPDPGTLYNHLQIDNFAARVAGFRRVPRIHSYTKVMYACVCI